MKPGQISLTSISSLRKLLEKGDVWFAQGVEKGERRDTFAPSAKRLATFGIPEIEGALRERALAAGMLHEFFLEDALTFKEKKSWHPPLLLLLALIHNAFRAQKTKKEFLIWIGRRVWPNGASFPQETLPQFSSDMLKQSIFIDPRDNKERLWAILESAASSAVFSVVADGSSMTMTLSRRLQLAATKGSALLFLTRPPWESTSPSAAVTRWKLSPLPSTTEEPRWLLSLLRARGSSVPLSWQVVFSYEQENNLSLSPDLVDRPYLATSITSIVSSKDRKRSLKRHVA